MADMVSEMKTWRSKYQAIHKRLRRWKDDSSHPKFKQATTEMSAHLNAKPGADKVPTRTEEEDPPRPRLSALEAPLTFQEHLLGFHRYCVLVFWTRGPVHSA